eukprot:CAMPEP_0194754546 /NCGR_PEP_ID=MMETSP0323_2-20130528/8499_1 /TAXON_ID=2866 ORGANISM="Crypthecodinium cohnii, Strain Seligo" /NCGR_SAMPLE_ID=MMETSP0323_2 /ASSEMBLY_ACC=CAM_ASM_000346 /LENGTH=177 /DNA_ID=CAMNT_0039673137 /DNA_START=449 /DNA_END=981 /DNA_ORIENTATION=-
MPSNSAASMSMGPPPSAALRLGDGDNTSINADLDHSEEGPDVVRKPNPGIVQQGGEAAQRMLEMRAAKLKGRGMLATDLDLITCFTAPRGDPYIKMLKAMQQIPTNSVLQLSPWRRGVNHSSVITKTARKVMAAQTKNTTAILAKAAPRAGEYFVYSTNHSTIMAAPKPFVTAVWYR